MRLPIDTTGLRFLLVRDAEPVRDYETKRVKDAVGDITRRVAGSPDGSPEPDEGPETEPPVDA